MADRDNLKIEVSKEMNAVENGNAQVRAAFSGALCWDFEPAEYGPSERMYEKALNIADEVHRRVFAGLAAGQSGTIHSPTKYLEGELRLARDRIATLEKANADLHSRLDELRRVFGGNAIRQHVFVGEPGRAASPPFRGTVCASSETASARFAEHTERVVSTRGFEATGPIRGVSNRSDPAGGG